MLRIVPGTERELKKGEPLSAIPVVLPGWKRAGHPHFFIRHLACGLEKGSWGDSARCQLPAPSATRPDQALGLGGGCCQAAVAFPSPPSLRLHQPSASFPCLGTAAAAHVHQTRSPRQLCLMHRPADSGPWVSPDLWYWERRPSFLTCPPSHMPRVIDVFRDTLKLTQRGN